MQVPAPLRIQQSTRPSRQPIALKAQPKHRSQMDNDKGPRTVVFDSPQGLKLTGLLQSSNSTAGSTSKCVLLCHGYASHKNGFQMPALAAALADGGYNSFRFDFSGNGDSEGTFRFANYQGEADEIQAAKKHLEQREGQAVVALLGHSKGGDDVILYASLYDDIPLVINVAGRFWMDQGITMRFGEDIFERVKQGPVTTAAQRDDGYSFSWQLTDKDLQERVSLDIAAAAAAIKHSKVLTIHGTADAVIPVDDGRQIAATITTPGSRLVEVEGADHNFRVSDVARQQMVDAVLAFLQEDTLLN